MLIRPLILAALFVPAAALAAAPKSFDAVARELGRGWLADHDGIGLSVGVYANGQRYFYNFGVTELDGGKAPTRNTVYEIGALSKTIAGQLLARAVVEGRASTTDEAAKFLEEPYPNLENGGEVVRLSHLVNMTSQLPDVIPDVSQIRAVPGELIQFTRARAIAEFKPEEFLRQLHRLKPRALPGGDPAQSNVASQLLGVVLEKLYGLPYAEIVAREIERPLKMASGTQPPRNLLAKGYSAQDALMPETAGLTQFAVNALRYSSEDLLRFVSWQVAERDASVKLAHQPSWSTVDKHLRVGFFWIETDTPQGRRLRYSGATSGFSGHCDVYPDAGIGIVLLANKSTDRAQDTLRALSEKLVDSLRAQREAGVVSPPPSSSEPPRQPDR